MKVLILSFSSNQVNEDSFVPNKRLTFSCVEECEKQLKMLNNDSFFTVKFNYDGEKLIKYDLK